MKKIKAVIIEDEFPATDMLKDTLLSLRPDWDVMLLPGNIKEAVDWFQNNSHPDILFLDIQLSDGNSFLFIEQANPDSMIVFTTAYDEYALRAFSVNSIDYLLKPLQPERLKDTILKFENLFLKYRNDYLQQISLLDFLQNFSGTNKRYQTRFLVPNGNKLQTLTVENIAYFYSENKVTFAVSKQGKEYLIDLPLSKLEEQLDPHLFYRVNRQVILKTDCIQYIESDSQNKVIVHVTPSSKEKIIISRLNVTNFKTWLNS